MLITWYMRARRALTCYVNNTQIGHIRGLISGVIRGVIRARSALITYLVTIGIGHVCGLYVVLFR